MKEIKNQTLNSNIDNTYVTKKSYNPSSAKVLIPLISAVQKNSRSRKNKEPSNVFLKQNSILATLIHDAVPKSLKRPRSTTQAKPSDQRGEFVHFKEFFNETGLLDDGGIFQSFIEDLAQNGFADEMAKQINCKIASASHNGSFHNNIVEDIFSSSAALNKVTSRNVLNEISNVVKEKATIETIMGEEPFLSYPAKSNPQLKDTFNNQLGEKSSEIYTNQHQINTCFYSNNNDFQNFCTQMSSGTNEIMLEINDENSQNVNTFGF